MMIGRPKTALKKSVGKIRKSSEPFAFYLLLSGQDEPLLFCDIKPNKSPRRYRSPVLIDRHLQKSRLMPEGLGNLKGFRSCAGVVSWDGTKLCFQVVSKSGGANATQLKKALGKPPLSVLVGSHAVAEPEQPGDTDEAPSPEELDAAFAELENEIAFELELSEELSADTEALAARLAAGDPGAVAALSALGVRLLSQTTLAASPECLKALTEAAGSTAPFAEMLEMMGQDFARCKGEVSLAPTDALRDAHLARLPPESERTVAHNLIPRLYHLFRGGKPAAVAAGRQFALSQSGGDAARLKDAYGSLSAEQRDLEQGVLMLNEGGLIAGSPPRIKAEYADDFDELRAVIDGLLAIYAAPTLDAQDPLSWIAGGLSKAVGLESNMLDTVGPYLEALEEQALEAKVTMGVAYRCSAQKVLLERKLTASDLSAGVDATFSTEAALHANSTGTLQIKGGKVNLTGEVKLGATAESKLSSHSGLSYNNSELFAVDLTGKVAVGAEVEAYGVITVKDGVIRIRIRSSASAGVGGGVDAEVAINHEALITAFAEAGFYRHLAQNIGKALAGLLEEVIAAISSGIESIERAGGSVLETMQEIFPSFSGGSSDFDALLRAVTP